jgi:hypothetical protein
MEGKDPANNMEPERQDHEEHLSDSKAVQDSQREEDDGLSKRKPKYIDAVDASLIDEPYDSPFYSKEWEEWLEMQTQAVKSLSEFQYACAHPNPQEIASAAFDLLEVAYKVQYEASMWAPFIRVPNKETRKAAGKQK